MGMYHRMYVAPGALCNPITIDETTVNDKVHISTVIIKGPTCVCYTLVFMTID